MRSPQGTQRARGDDAEARGSGYSGAVLERFFFLLASVYFFWNVARGRTAGTVWVHFGSIRRSQDETLFWFGMGINVLLGLAFLLGFVFGTGFFKALGG